MNKQTQITKYISIEDLVEYYPFSVHYLSKRGIRCVACGDPVWLTLEEAAREKGFDDNKIDEFVNKLKILALSDDNYYEGKIKRICVDKLDLNINRKTGT